MNTALHAASFFKLDGKIISCEPYGFGHINRTFLVVCNSGKRYILQGINSNVFADVAGLMENISAVTAHLSKQCSDPRQYLNLIETTDGRSYFTDDDGGSWRVYDFIEDSLCLQAPENAEDFYQSAVAFGTFQKQLADFPAKTLHEIIPNFHNTPDRYRRFHEAIEKDAVGRAASVQAEIEDYLSYENEAATLQKQLESGVLPLRVTHNDTKLNNVMLDAKTRKALCVIDLDTVMPGLAAFDFGDSIRFGAATAAEDEKDLSKVSMDIGLYTVFTRGFIRSCAGMTEEEKLSLPWGAKLMTLECGVRFLTDYLNGDVYFSVHYPEHNLDRCRTQIKMVHDMDAKWEEMYAIVRREGGIE
ncbi:MAG: aminoglycoside phosphotransferase family protein [Eubacteriales bacterium]|nr:aminoglycoside phosphotransferase family protein [Eubacteriales bacterium]